MTNYVVDTDGETGDYSTLDAAIDVLNAIGGDGTLDDDYTITCQATGDAADTAACSLDVTMSGHTLTIQTANGEEAAKDGWKTDRYRLEVNTGGGAGAISIVKGAPTIKGLQIKVTFDTYERHGIYMGASEIINIDSCRIQVDDSSTVCEPIRVDDSSGTANVYNTIFEGTGGSNYGQGPYVREGTLNLYNCIVRNFDQGCMYYNGALKMRNCAVFDNNDDIYSYGGSGSVDVDYCALDDADSQTHGISPLDDDWTKEFNAPSSGDYTLLATGNCYQAGADNPSSGLYTTDIDGDAYNSGAYSIGVDEIASEGGSSVPIIFQQMKRRRA